MSVLKKPHVNTVAPVYNGESYLLESNNEHGTYSKEVFSLVTFGAVARELPPRRS
jgi:hypothetical protein